VPVGQAKGRPGVKPQPPEPKPAAEVTPVNYYEKVSKLPRQRVVEDGRRALQKAAASPPAVYGATQHVHSLTDLFQYAFRAGPRGGDVVQAVAEATVSPDEPAGPALAPVPQAAAAPAPAVPPSSAVRTPPTGASPYAPVRTAAAVPAPRADVVPPAYQASAPAPWASAPPAAPRADGPSLPALPLPPPLPVPEVAPSGLKAAAADRPVTLPALAVQPGGPVDIMSLLNALASAPTPLERDQAAQAGARVDWRRQPQIVDELLKAIACEAAPPELRVTCIRCLVEMRAATGPVVITLRALGGDGDRQVRAAAAQALGLLGAK
jgi:hypothetical protein